jgi:hypothetical protein
MQTPKQQPDTQQTGKPSDNNTDVNQQDHISSQVQDENLTDSEEDDDDVEDDDTPEPDEQDLEENEDAEGNKSGL